MDGHENGYYIDTCDNSLSSRGLPVATQDALGAEMPILYDDPLSPVAGHGHGRCWPGRQTPAYNYRLLQPEEHDRAQRKHVHTSSTIGPIGLPQRQYVIGLDAQGNATLGGSADKPEIAFAYDFLNFAVEGKPNFVHTARRIHHAGDNLSDETIASCEYSDGYGRLIQTRAQAEDLVFGDMGADVGLTQQAGRAVSDAVGHRKDDSVVVSGWQFTTTKGRSWRNTNPFSARVGSFIRLRRQQGGSMSRSYTTRAGRRSAPCIPTARRSGFSSAGQETTRTWT